MPSSRLGLMDGIQGWSPPPASTNPIARQTGQLSLPNCHLRALFLASAAYLREHPPPTTSLLAPPPPTADGLEQNLHLGVREPGPDPVQGQQQVDRPGQQLLIRPHPGGAPGPERLVGARHHVAGELHHDLRDAGGGLDWAEDAVWADDLGRSNCLDAPGNARRSVAHIPGLILS